VILGDQPVRLIGIAAEGVHDVGNLLPVTMIGAGNRVMMRHRDNPRPEVDEGEDDALRLLGDRLHSPQGVAQPVRLADRVLHVVRWFAGNLVDDEGHRGPRPDKEHQRCSKDSRNRVSGLPGLGHEIPDQSRSTDRAEHLCGRSGPCLPQ
jgi:hypothetical protein